MYELKPENIQKFFEEVATANKDAWDEQVSFFNEMVKRNAECFTSLADARVTSLRDMGQAKTLEEAFEANNAFGNKAREELGYLQEDSVKAWDDLRHSLENIYTHVAEAAKAA